MLQESNSLHNNKVINTPTVSATDKTKPELQPKETSITVVALLRRPFSYWFHTGLYLH